jgi:predicted PurR-regulated permease PerM
MIGLFIGPVLLAVSWRLYDAWVHEVPPPPKDPDVWRNLKRNVSNISEK